MATRIQHRRGTATEWETVNPVLASGEPGYETDTGKEKTGDGTTPWNELPAQLSTTELEPYVLKTELDVTGKADKSYVDTMDAQTLSSAKGYTDSKVAASTAGVSQVNGKTGNVTLGAADVGAQPSGDYATKDELADKGTSNLKVGTTASDAKAGNYKPSYADLPAGSTITVSYTSPRPTSRTDIVVQFAGGTEQPAAALPGDIHLLAGG